MGRPPLGNKATTVRLSEETLQRIDSYVGVKQRAVFIREAIEARLKYMDSLKKFMTDKE